jgi:hypothetical protein
LSRYPSFRLGIGEFELACHRVGLSEKEDIWSSFPTNDGAAQTMVERQLWLPRVGKDAGIERARKLILAHMGNADDGLRAVYICVPGKTKGGLIMAWAFCRLIWKAKEATQSAEESREIAPEETIADPIVRRKRNRNKHESKE